MKRRNKINRNNLGNDRQPQTFEGDQEKEQNESQCNIGPLKLAGRAILLAIKDGIGMKKIDKSDKDEKIEQVDEKKFPNAVFFHELQL